MTADEIKLAYTRTVDRLVQSVKGGLENTSDLNNPLRRMFVKWVARFAGFIRARWIRLSKGGGEWPDLAPSTKKARATRGKTAQRRLASRVRKIMKTTRVDEFGAGTYAKIKANLIYRSMKFPILRDRGILLNAVTPGAPGNRVEHVAGGIKFGFDDHAPHSKSATVGKILKAHHYGVGRLPVRTILVAPDERTQAGMRADAAQAMKELRELAQKQ